MLSAPIVLFGSKTSPERLRRKMNDQFHLPGAGDRFQLRKEFTQENVQAFCEATGDLNLAHLQGLADNLHQGNAQARITVPGHFVTAQITRAFITMFKQIAQRPIFPIYAGQQTRYMSPVHVGDTTRTDLAVRQIDYKRSKSAPGQANVIYTVDTDIHLFDPQTCKIGQQAVKGQATIIIRVGHDPELQSLISRIKQANRDAS